MPNQAGVTAHVATLADLRAALDSLRESKVSGDVLRCRPRDAAEVERVLIYRGKKLGPYIRQLVRFVRLAELYRPGHPWALLYESIRVFRVENFRRAVMASLLPAAAIRVQDDRVVFIEPAMQSQSGQPFELEYHKMPILATLLDVLHNTFGYDTLYSGETSAGTTASEQMKGIFRERVTEVPGRHANDVARRFQSCFNAWLSEVTGSTSYATRQERAIVGFLRSCGSLSEGFVKLPEKIDDEVIFAFWKNQIAKARAPGNEALVEYRSAVRSMLRYRRALVKAIAEEAIAKAEVLGEDVKDLIDHDASGELSNEHSRDWSALPPLAASEWRNPLLILASPPCNEVTWLFSKDLRLLRNYLGEFKRQSDDAGGSLMGPDQFDLRFLTTLLRVDVFAGVQAKITDKIRRKQAAADALRTALAPVEDTSYENMRKTYHSIRGQVGKAAEAVVDLFRGQRPNSPRRKGFQPENPNDPHMRAAYEEAVPALEILLRELDRLLKRLDNYDVPRQKEPDRHRNHAAQAAPAAGLTAAARRDRDLFEKALRELYA